MSQYAIAFPLHRHKRPKMSEINLKPCPFCGSDAEMLVGEIHTTVQCKSLCAQMVSHVDDDPNAKIVAIECWNDRASDWQPIETAPKDGFTIMLRSETACATASANKNYGEPYPINPSIPYPASWRETRLYGEKWDYVWRNESGAQEYYPDPTHWMPMPAPPQESEND